MNLEQNLSRKANYILDDVANFISIPSKENIEHVINSMFEYQTAWVSEKAMKIKEVV